MNAIINIKKITNVYNDISPVGKVLFFLSAFILLRETFKILNVKEGFTKKVALTDTKTETKEIYDNFYANVYDMLVYDELKDEFEISNILQIISKTELPTVLDIGCGTGNHVKELYESGIKNVYGIDISKAMILKAKEKYPEISSHFIEGDFMELPIKSFTDLTCLYFTIYYMKDKRRFFSKCKHFLSDSENGGSLIIHLVDREKFDPILAVSNPLYMVSLQKYAPERITTSNVKFNNMSYSSKFDITEDSKNATFEEKFIFKDNEIPTRKHEHKLYMETIDEILNMAKEQGFVIGEIIDLVKVGYEYQYLYQLRGGKEN